SCFSTPTARTRALCTGYSGWIIDPFSLRSGDELLKIFCIAAAERKYFSGTSSSKTCDNIQSPSFLWHSEVGAVMHTPFDTIPQFNKRGEDGFKCPAFVMR